jgi:hypothetical protein
METRQGGLSLFRLFAVSDLLLKGADGAFTSTEKQRFHHSRTNRKELSTHPALWTEEEEEELWFFPFLNPHTKAAGRMMTRGRALAEMASPSWW